MDSYLRNLPTFINIRTDYGFKKIFGSPENKHILIRFLNALLGDEIKVKDVVYLNKEMQPKDADGKRIIYDVYCMSQNGEHHFILEMQNEYKTPFEERVLYYTSRIISTQGRQSWNYALRPVISVVLTGFDFSHMKPALIHDVKLVDVMTGDVLTDKMRMIFLSLKYLGDRTWEECKTEIERIMYLIKNMDKMDKDSEAYKCKEYQDFFDASETANIAAEDMVTYSNSLQRLLDDERWREEVREEVRLEEREKARKEEREKARAEIREMAWSEGMVEGRAEGMAEGRAEGLAEGRIEEREENALKMLKYGISEEMIINITGLSESDIAKLRARLN